MRQIFRAILDQYTVFHRFKSRAATFQASLDLRLRECGAEVSALHGITVHPSPLVELHVIAGQRSAQRPSCITRSTGSWGSAGFLPGQLITISGQKFNDLNGNGRWDAGDLWAKLGHDGDRPVTGDWNFPAPPLRAASSGSGAADVTAAELQSTVDAALARLSQAGLDSGTLARLGATQFALGNLPSGTLGLAFLAGNRVVIDADAAGHGWFVDGTPDDDAEFLGGLAASGSPAAGRMDLLSAVLHELGHVAGLDHGAGAMAETLAPGARSLDGLDAFFAR